MISRRSLTKAGLAGLTASLLPVPGAVRRALAAAPPSPPMSPYMDALPVPPVIDKTAGGSLTLTMKERSHRFHGMLPTATAWGYQESCLGPTVVAERGKPLTMTFRNQLGNHLLANSIDYSIHGTQPTDGSQPRTVIHLHGGNVEPQSDGWPEDSFKPGGQDSYYYHNDQESATLWYHDHSIGITRLNVYAGLAGNYWLRDDAELSLNLPSGEYEMPLVIQDRNFNYAGEMVYPLAPWEPAVEGDRAVVNGKVWPYLNVKKGWYRFRILNACNSRTLDLYLGGKRFYQIGTDGGLLPNRIALTRIKLAPAERADILVDFSGDWTGQRYTLTNSLVGRGPVLPNIMQFRVQSGAGWRGSVPSALRPALPALSPVRTRNVALVEVPGAIGPQMVMLNNLHWTTPHIEKPQKDTVERWNIINLTQDLHPIHLHYTHFLVENRQYINAGAYANAAFGGVAPGDGPWPPPSPAPYLYGGTRSPASYERGWKDTVQVHPQEVTRILVPFGAGVPGSPIGRTFTGKYVWHCHILEHEDHEMMLPYEVVS